MTSVVRPRAGLRIFVTFALGYYLSYLLRTVNAVISPALTAELGLSSAQLGLLTSTYFLAFGLAQIPVGIALDRYGPRRVEALLLLLAAGGAAVFALGEGFLPLAGGRAMIGLGVSACLMGALKGFASWYPAERQSSMTGFIMAAGALGALTASTPVEALLPWVGWRGVFWLVAASGLVVAVLMITGLPDEAAHTSKDTLGAALASVGHIFRSPAFLRFAAASACFTGGFMALQGLWAVPWLMHVNGLELARAAHYLVVLNVGMLCGQLAVGAWGTHLSRRGVRPLHLMRLGYAGMLAVEAAIVFDLAPLFPAWFLLGLLSAVNAQSYLAAASHFPRALFARVSTAVNLMAFAGAFAVQWGIGLIVDHLRGGGMAMAAALGVALGILVTLQVLSYLPLWFTSPPPQGRA
ncbi:MFS transporter [Azoarcus olearius]|uniref:Membrane transport protein n=1 Tax=Azoarcus sp. (strain BH72) TaxID=418699 RepID=A1K796_AZOSB|nr:MFS transporter [Azoarcus olearius]CAL94701.1 putative membrane transport protein [Azoarcus olearius]